MIGGVGSIAALFSTDYVRNLSRMREAFSIPDSALRIDGLEPTAPVAPERDPIADSVELSRDFPQFLAVPAYTPSPEYLMGLGSGRNASGQQENGATEQQEAAGGLPVDEQDGQDAPQETQEAEDPNAERGADGQPLDEQEQAQLQELKARDLEVRAHEQAHMSAGGSYAGAASYEYQQGPDGGRYAVGGEVSIDVSAERDPDATIAKMQTVKAAAMAPAEPSTQDFSVVAQATQMELQARAESSSAAAEGGEEGAGQSGETEGAGGTGEAGAAGGASSSSQAGGTSGTQAGGMSGAQAGGASSSPQADAAGIMPGVMPFASRIAQNAYAAGNISALAMSYTPLNIVA